MRQIKNNRFKLLFLAGICMLFSGVCLSQNTTSPSDFWSKVRYGGGIGLSFGNNSFSGALAPSAIYQADDQWAFGVGLNINYSKFNESKLLAYGASALTLFNPIRAIQLSAEFEQLRVRREFDLPGTDSFTDSYWYPALYMGVGYTTRNVTFGIRYDVLYDDDRSIYADPWAPFVRVYF